ncbi:hypothetical protein ACX6XY_13205 [Streptomyces sp. O3]
MALLAVITLAISWFWYTVWDIGNTNDKREKKAISQALEQARTTADDTASALNESNTTGNSDTLTKAVWEYTKAPVISYNGGREQLTATVAITTYYDQEGLILAGREGTVKRCFTFTYTYTRNENLWKPRTSERDFSVCHPVGIIDSMARSVEKRISNMHTEDLTLDGVRNALDGRYDHEVKSVARKGEEVTISVQFFSRTGHVDQCYQFTRRLPDNDSSPATRAPTVSCDLDATRP